MAQEITIGATYEVRKTFSAEEVLQFAKISGDNNPIHIDEEYAKAGPFKQRAVHGVLLTGLFSQIFGTIFPGPGGVYTSQNIRFLRPAPIGEEVWAVATLLKYDEASRKGVFRTECFNAKNKVLAAGESRVLFPES